MIYKYTLVLTIVIIIVYVVLINHSDINNNHNQNILCGKCNTLHQKMQYRNLRFWLYTLEETVIKYNTVVKCRNILSDKLKLECQFQVCHLQVTSL